MPTRWISLRRLSRHAVRKSTVLPITADLQYLSPLDQLVPRGYFGETLCFPCTDDRFYELLRNGLRGATRSLPYLSSLVTRTSAGVAMGKLRLSEPGEDSLDDMLVYHEVLDEGHITYEALREASFPIGALNRDIFYPNLPPHGVYPAPVVRARVTRIRGGYVLAVLLNHSVFDGTSLNDVLDLWASSCHLTTEPDRDEFNHIVIHPSRLDRRAILGGPAAVNDKYIAKPSDIYLEVSDKECKPRSSLHSEPVTVPVDLSTTLYKIPSIKLARLKMQINNLTTRLDLGVDFVSTNDVLCALIWSAATFAKTPDPSTPRLTKCFGVRRMRHDDTWTTGIAVNVRSRLDPALPPDWLGNALGVAWVNIPGHTLRSADGSIESLAKIARVAAAIRKGITEVDDKKFKNLVHYVDGHDDFCRLRWRPVDKMFDFYITSWAGQSSMYSKEWGAGAVENAKCEAIRCLMLVLPSIACILPPRERLAASTGEHTGNDVDSAKGDVRKSGGTDVGKETSVNGDDSLILVKSNIQTKAKKGEPVDDGKDVEVAITLEHAQMKQLLASELFNMYAEVIDTC
ncbi:transferase family-domain-containing protein [Podospora appendiculata]|uniref:Transferase family-domain-containing protein n=1 Tax=Podospora appendiculata TaxID=314037 RepID=A0AAE0X662_9PEZI|nr:transferase family-domain-containing protein [Podospora appendiculata]